MVDIIPIHYSSFLVISGTYLLWRRNQAANQIWTIFGVQGTILKRIEQSSQIWLFFSCGRVQNGKFHPDGDEVPSDNEGTPLVAVRNHDKHFYDSVFRKPCKPFSRKPDCDMIVWLNDCDEGCLW